MKPIFCEKCGKAITDKESGYSLRVFRKSLCASKCQKEERLLILPKKLAEAMNAVL